jgi:D-glycero-beta-D-manno-heptose-7-phosphate kinase
VQSTIGENRITTLLDALSGKRIAVVGDVMLDHYYWGSVSRISPEAPVPVVEVNEESVRLGGAANVAHNIAALGAEPFLIGVIGNDRNGEILASLMTEAGYATDGLLYDPTRPTTSKTRIIAHNQHVVRIDRESTTNIEVSVARRVIDMTHRSIAAADGLILQDYNKGIFTKDVIREITRLANEAGRLITVDPKFNNFFEYRDVTVFKPNRREIEHAFGVKLRTDDDFNRYGLELLQTIRAQSVLITRGEYGMTLIEKSGNISHVPTRTRSVADVSGAGDTVIATLTVLLAAGSDIVEASAISNFAGGLVCEEVGIVPVDRDRLRDTILRYERDNAETVAKESIRHG